MQTHQATRVVNTARVPSFIIGLQLHMLYPQPTDHSWNHD